MDSLELHTDPGKTEPDQSEVVIRLAVEGILEHGRAIGVDLSEEDATIYAHGAFNAIQSGGFKIVSRTYTSK